MANVMTQTAFVGSRVAVKTRTAAPARNLTVRAAAKFAGNWLPGSTQPAYLEKLPGAYGFVSSHLSLALPGSQRRLRRQRYTRDITITSAGSVLAVARGWAPSGLRPPIPAGVHLAYTPENKEARIASA